jgi:acetolactate synthase-1/2/3 large subunit
MPGSVADAVAEELALAGVDRVFGLPGGEVLFLVDALHRHGIQYTLCHHESAGGIAAAVYGKSRGRAGVVLTTLGPGASNLLLPVANSLLDREPLLAISADIPSSWPAAHTHQRLPLLEIFQPITKLAAPLRPGDCRRAVRAALDTVTSEPQGPAFLTLSAEDAQADAGEEDPGADGREPGPPGLDTDTAARLVRSRLGQARCPLVLVGLGTRWRDAEGLRHWLRAWRLPFGVTPKAKGMVPETDDLFVGVFGGMALDDLMLEALESADLVLGFGLDPVEIDKTWHTRAEVTWILESPLATGVLPPEAVVTEHRALLERLAAEPAPRTWQDPFVKVRQRRRAALEPRAAGLTPASIVLAAATLPHDTVVTTDVGSHKFLFGQFWPAAEPGRFWVSNGLSGMGYGLPAALGARLARPDRPVLAVLGDGGFAMTAAELETARREGAPMTVLVLLDGSLSLIRAGQEARRLPRYGVDFGALDTVAIAHGYGAKGIRVSTAAELEAALADSLRADQVTVVEVPLDPDLYRGLV